MDKMTKNFYLKRINYLESEVSKLYERNNLLNKVIQDYEDQKEIVFRFVRDRIIELENSRMEDEPNIEKHLVCNMFIALKKLIDEVDIDD